MHTPFRPAFLLASYANGRAIVAAFQALSKDEAVAVDRWLVANIDASWTHEERHLFQWINETDPQVQS